MKNREDSIGGRCDHIDPHTEITSLLRKDIAVASLSSNSSSDMRQEVSPYTNL